MRLEALLLPATSSHADVCCCGVCFLPVSTSISGDGAGGASSLETHDTDLLPQEKVMLGKARDAIPVLLWGCVSDRVSQQGSGTVTKGDCSWEWGLLGGWRTWAWWDMGSQGKQVHVVIES